MSYNPEYYGASEVQGTARDLFEGEINVVENIKNEEANKESLVRVSEDTFPAMEVSPARDLLPGEINVVENIRKYEENKAGIVHPDDEEVQMSELKRMLNELKTELGSKG